MTSKRRRCPDCGGSLTGDHPSPTGDHPQVGLTSEYGVHAHVDVGIAQLVTACWDLDIATTNSCQGGADEHAYLAFPAGFTERFARAATSGAHPEELEAAPEDSLDLRIYEFRDFDDPLGWRWVVGYPWATGFAAHFPPADIPELVRRLESYRW